MSAREDRKPDVKAGLSELAALRQRLPSRPPRVSAAPPPQAPPAPPEAVRPDADFSEAMGELGVEALRPGPERIVPTPPELVPGGKPARRPQGPTGPPPADADEAAFEEGMRELLALVRGPRRRDAAGGVGHPVLDLHGFTESDAVFEARRFTRLHRQAGSRTVRVITGRGRHGDAIVRPAIERWLGNAADVASWRWGTPPEGGAGVVVLTLRRREGRR